MMDFKRFQNPESILRPAPFWAINDKITPDETARQMHDIIDKGFSGGFFHSRHGLTTDYMGDEWFAAMHAALDVAKKEDGYLWLYDEDLWPSGNAGGQVAGMKDEYRAAMLWAEFVPKGMPPMPGDDEAKAACIIHNRHGADIDRAEQISMEDAALCMDSERLIFRRNYSYKTAWWSGESYANLLNPEAVGKFIELTHEVYKRELGEEFGRHIPGIFTDEPQITTRACALPWWEGLPGVYNEWTGRNFWADIPYLFFDGPDAKKIRLLFHRTVLKQFCRAFTERIFSWCGENNLAFTGHVNAEDSLAWQIRCHSGGVMSHYRHMHIPGIDHLCRQIDGWTTDGELAPLLTVKQASSAARQLGRPQVLTEIFGVSRHTCTFEDFKWLGDFDLVLGANFFCSHLSLYSARGRRKKDYPPNWNYQQTYWEDMRSLTDYFTRVSSALTSGEARPDVLILHPIEGATAMHRYGWPVKDVWVASAFTYQNEQRTLPIDLPEEDFAGVDYLDRMFRRTVEAALNAGYDCDLGDEGFLADMGGVRDGRFVVGEMSYSAVVVPPADTWRPSTYALLKEFAEAGGKVIILGVLPTELDCEGAAGDWRELASIPGVASVPSSARQLQDALDKAVQRTFSLRDTEGNPIPKTYVQHRADAGQEIFFIANSDQYRSHDYQFTLFGGADTPMAIWNPMDGSRALVEPAVAGRDARYRFTLHPAGSLLLVAGEGAADGAAPVSGSIDLSKGDVTPLCGRWDFSRSEENVLVMDRISASVDGGKTWWPADMEWRVRERIAEHFCTVESLQWQPWVAIRKGIMDGLGGDVNLRYTFNCSTIPYGSVALVIEDIEKGRVSVNGAEVDTKSATWHWDRGFGRVDISAHVKEGLNTVEFKVDYNFLAEVEPAYIIGDFGVRLSNPYEAEIVSEPGMIESGSWMDQGYPFYSGSVTYKTGLVIPDDGRRRFLRLVKPSGVLFKMKVNGDDAGNIIARPWQLELTPFMRPGANRIEITVVSSRQNTLGPLHEKEGDDNMWCGPNAFTHEPDLREEYSLFDYGLLGGAEIVAV